MIRPAAFEDVSIGIESIRVGCVRLGVIGNSGIALCTQVGNGVVMDTVVLNYPRAVFTAASALIHKGNAISTRLAGTTTVLPTTSTLEEF